MGEPGFRALVEHAPDAIVVSREGIVLYANGAAARLLGHDSPDELVGKPMTFLDARSIEVMRRRIAAMQSGGEPLVPREYPAKRRDGSEITAEITSTVIDFDGAPAVLAYARDVTERSRLRAQLAHADRLASLGMMAAGIAHEINNPLAFSSLAAQMLERRVTEEDQPFVAEVRAGIDRIAAIVRDLKTFGRFEDEAPGRVDLAAAIESAERLVAHEIRPRARLVKDIGELPAITGIARRVEQVFVNLLLNAALAVDDGTITVSARATSEHVLVAVRDDGVGIAAADLERVFEPFFTTRAQTGGTGLGLAICRDIMRRAGGDLVARSAPGEGTTMDLTFARAVPEPIAPRTIPAPPPQTDDGRHLRVLVVDDEPLIVRALGGALAGFGDVVGETNAERALERMLGDEAFDAIICDVMMAGMTGVDLHERVARERPEVARRFVFVTGGTYTARERKYLENVSNQRLSKPFAMPDLRKAIETAAGPR
ncbi:MAG TPA: ATP-binding protein [Polyangiaceae bacterium]